MSRPPAGGRALGYLEAVTAAAFWGSSGIFATALFRRGVSPESVALLRPVVGLVCLAALVAARAPSALRVTRRGFVALAAGGGAAVGIFQVAYQLSTDAVGVPKTVALLYLAPGLVVALSGPVLGEWPSRWRVALAAVALTGVWLSVLGAEGVTPTFGTSGISGPAWGVVAAASYAAYTLFGRHAAPRYGSPATALYSTLGACVLLALVLPSRGNVTLPATPAAWALLVAFGVLTMAVAQFLFFDALGRIEAGRASIATAAEPIVAAVLATLLLGQELSPLGWLGIGLVAAGVVGVGLTQSAADDR